MRLRIVITLIIAFVLAEGVYPAAADPVAVRDFEDETWSDGLVDVRPTDLSRTDLVTSGFAGNALEVTIPEGAFRGLGPFDRLPLPVPNEAWYRYHVRLTSWNSADTGKLPGLSGSYSSSAKGCIPSTPDEPGWSARGMFGVPGTNGAPPGNVPIGTYLYHLDQVGACGDELFWPGASPRARSMAMHRRARQAEYPGRQRWIGGGMVGRGQALHPHRLGVSTRRGARDWDPRDVAQRLLRR